MGTDKPKLKGWQEAADRLGVSVGWLKSQTNTDKGRRTCSRHPRRSCSAMTTWMRGRHRGRWCGHERSGTLCLIHGR
jgi:hypothetical protein